MRVTWSAPGVPGVDLPEAELGRGLDHELASVKAPFAEGSQRIVDRGRGTPVPRQARRRPPGTSPLRPPGGGWRLVRGIADDDRAAPVPRVWRHDGFEAGW